MAWSPDSQHLLVVDRDRSKQVSPGLSVGVRDDLWIVDISSLKTSLVHASATRVSGNTGLVVSPDGRYIASFEGSGFGDACFLDAKQIFFEVARDYSTVKPIRQDQFAGVPKTADGMMYPVSVGSWQGNTHYLVPLNGTCGSFDPALIGTYLFDVPGLKAELQSASATPFSVGDLGWGEVHGVVVRQRKILEKGAKLVEAGKLGVLVSYKLPLADVAEAHRLIEQGGITGKIVLIKDVGDK